MKKANLSAVVLSQRQTPKLTKTLKSLDWCKQVIVIKRPKITNFSAIRNMGLKKATQPWVLFVDSDEIITPQLAKEIKSAISKSKNIQGYYFKRQDIFLSKILHFGETANLSFLRLARKNAGNWVKPVHEVWQIKGKTKLLKYPLLHYPHDSIANFYQKITNYALLEARSRLNTSKPQVLLELIFFPFGKFILNYIIRLGFLDGFPGLVMAFMMSLHSALVRINIYHELKDN